MMQIYVRFCLAFVIASYLAVSGYKKKSLNITGSIAALIVGFLSFGFSYRFGFILIIFYYTGSKFTKLDEKLKASLEDDYAVGGQRNCKQVLCNSILAIFVALVYFSLVGEDCHLRFSTTLTSLGGTVKIFGYTFNRARAGAILWAAYVAHFACAAGDTWASEIGILSPSKPRLITRCFLVEVPPGTNGGMSLLGTIASASGGFTIGLAFYIMSWIIPSSEVTVPSQYPMIFLGLFCGLTGSLFDSLIGGLFQATYYSVSKKMIIKHKDKLIRSDPSIIQICGYDFLSNDAVNFLSILLTMIFAMYISPSVFCYLDNMHC